MFTILSKRFEEFANEAGGEFSEGTGIPNTIKFTEETFQKFAELIVRECDKYVDERFDNCEPWMRPGDLLKHFEIEHDTGENEW